MKLIALCKVAAVAALMLFASSRPADATTYPVFFGQLTASATLANTLDGDDTILIDTLVTTEVGALLQSVTFTLAPSVASFTGFAAWEITTAAGPGPRLVGVNIDIFDAANTLVASDFFEGVLAGFAHSSFDSPIGPGTYTVVITGTGVRDSSLDLSLSFAAIPEPGTSALLLSGLGILAFRARRSSKVSA